MQQKPSLGRVVLTLVDKTMNNGSDTAPAVITRVWDDGKVNLRVLANAFTTPMWFTSVMLVDTEAEARATAPAVAWWPARV